MEASGRDSLDAARGNIQEGRKREGADIQGEAMHGDPFADSDPDTRNFSLIYPCSGEAFPGMRNDAEVGQGIDQDAFEEPEIGMEVSSVVSEIQDGVTYQLPRSMVGGLSSTIDLKYGVRQVGRLSQAALITGSSDCVDRRVFHKKKGLGSVS